MTRIRSASVAVIFAATMAACTPQALETVSAACRGWLAGEALAPPPEPPVQ